MEDIKVSIICNTYNHEQYIRSALESFVSQKTNFAFEVLVHDDASTDGTASIIKEYAEKYPEIVKPIFQTQNQYSQGIRFAYLYQYPRAKGEYWALCEGDDYWCDEYKLQKQYDAMEMHPEVDICAHAAHIECQGKFVGKVAPASKNTIFSVEEVILGGGGFVATNSLMVRKGVWDQNPDYKKILSLDYVYQIQGSLRGGMLYLSDCMAVYRSMAIGSWSSRMQKNTEKMLQHLNKVETMLVCLDRETEYQYSLAIAEKIEKNKVTMMLLAGEYKKILSKENKPYYRQLSKKEKLKIQLFARFPILTSKKK